MTGKRKAIAIGRLLISSAEIDTKRGENKRLQNILGEALYYQKGNKWYYDIEKMNRLTILELNEIADKIEKSVQ